MSKVARAWSRRSGGELGFSMGRFDPDYVRHQRCFLAWRQDQLIAFATFHTSDDDWCLDLMRSADHAADGTMHALLAAAIEDAASEGITRLSLAAMPLATPPRLSRPFCKGQGLRRFKMSFAPRRRPLYFAAPSPSHLVLSGLDILLRIRFPAPIGRENTAGALQEMQGWFARSALVRNPFRTHVHPERETPVTIEVNQ